jgi:hypothetical protein
VQAWRNARSSRGLYGLGGGGVVITGALKVGMGAGELRRQIARISGDDICAQLSCGSEAAALWAGIARLAAPVMAGTGLGRLGGSDSQPIVQNTSPTTAATAAAPCRATVGSGAGIGKGSRRRSGTTLSAAGSSLAGRSIERRFISGSCQYSSCSPRIARLPASMTITRPGAVMSPSAPRSAFGNVKI